MAIELVVPVIILLCHRQETEDSWQFASSCYFNNIFFYASGNKVYRVDLNSFVPLETKIYEYPDPSSRITKMKFRHERIAEMSLDWGQCH